LGPKLTLEDLLVIHRKLLGLLTLLASGAAVAAVSLAILPASALAAGPATECGGWLKRAPTSDDSNALAYNFQCNWGITAYSIIATRQPSDDSTIDDFGPDGLAYTPAAAGTPSTNPVPGIDFVCQGQVPGNGINCGLSSGYLAAPNFVEGWIDTSVPYCSYIPKGSTQVVPQAIVSLIVTDTNGVEAGPFRLNVSPGCPPVKIPAKAKPKTAKKKTAKHTHATK
jgi:hypothetical protein